MNGLVLEGGARRCMFTCGVTDCLMNNSIGFDYIIGVSAGAQVGLDFVSGQAGRSKEVIMPHNEENSEISKNLVRNNFACDLEEIVWEFPNKKYPFDFKAYAASGILCEMTATDCRTAEPVYFSEKEDEELLFKKLCASCSVPVVCSSVQIDGRDYIDGSIADAVPFKRALEAGCKRALVVLAKPMGESATDYSRYRFVIEKKYGRDYPVLTDSLINRIKRYEKQLEELYEYEKAGKVMIIRPARAYVKSYEASRESLEIAYACGYKTAETKMNEIKEFLK